MTALSTFLCSGSFAPKPIYVSLLAFASRYHTLSGKELSKLIKRQIKDEIAQIKNETPSFNPVLRIIQVGNRPDSSTYVRMKEKAAIECGIKETTEKLPESITQSELLRKVRAINKDTSINGLLIQLPLPKHLDEEAISNAISPEKDVDGLTTFNAGELAKKQGRPFFVPCTPAGIMKLLKHYNIELSGKLAVVIGRSDIVGSPVSALLKKENATVVCCHSKTKNIEQLLGMADIVVAACGKPDYVKGEWLKPGCVVIDVGINYVRDETKKSGRRLVGDVNFETAKVKASHITPVPGGVGPMTVTMLMDNTLQAAKRQLLQQMRAPKIEPLPLTPVVDKNGRIPPDFEISKSQTPKEVQMVARELGILEDELEPYGKYKAKVSLSVLDRLKSRSNGKYILVSAITPTPLGEGKSTTVLGIVQALSGQLGIPSIATLRQPSMGPTFGVKGGAAGGGYSQAIPMDDFNLHMTGDIHAIGTANNLLAAAVDTRIFHERTQRDTQKFYNRLVPTISGRRTFTPSMLRRLQKLGIRKTDPNDLTSDEIDRFSRLNIDPNTITLRRVVDMNDRMLRQITIGQSPTEKGITRTTGFDITAASELMGILALSNSFEDMERRIRAITVGFDNKANPVTADDIGCAGALTALLKDAIKPNLMQTLEGTPVLVHAGPFANLSVGTSSVIADLIGLKLVGSEKSTANSNGYVVTEAGFDFTMGGERFFDIKCRSSGLKPDAVVLVATIRALKLHGGGPAVKPGQSLPSEYTTENTELVQKGVCNLVKQIENAKQFGVPVLVAINHFPSDSSAELEVVKEASLKAGASAAVVATNFADGGKGAIDLAQAIVETVNEESSSVTPLYDVNDTFEEKVLAVVQKLYNGRGIDISPEAEEKLDLFNRIGYGKLPVCIAKTQYSLSHDPQLKGVPSDFIFPIKDVRLCSGGGYLQVMAGDIQTLPGLPTYAGFMNVELGKDGEIQGLF